MQMHTILSIHIATGYIHAHWTMHHGTQRHIYLVYIKAYSWSPPPKLNAPFILITLHYNIILYNMSLFTSLTLAGTWYHFTLVVTSRGASSSTIFVDHSFWTLCFCRELTRIIIDHPHANTVLHMILTYPCKRIHTAQQYESCLNCLGNHHRWTAHNLQKLSCKSIFGSKQNTHQIQEGENKCLCHILLEVHTSHPFQHNQWDRSNLQVTCRCS